VRKIVESGFGSPSRGNRRAMNDVVQAPMYRPEQIRTEALMPVIVAGRAYTVSRRRLFWPVVG
jgi:hypothetical protein